MRKPKKIKLFYEYVGDKGSESDKLESKQRLQRTYDMIFDEVAKKLTEDRKKKKK